MLARWKKSNCIIRQAIHLFEYLIYESMLFVWILKVYTQLHSVCCECFFISLLKGEVQ